MFTDADLPQRNLPCSNGPEEPTSAISGHRRSVFEHARGRSEQTRVKSFRLEAVRAGFKKAWQERDYAKIIAVAGTIPANVLQDAPKLLMW